jgi:hypothetical protein
MEGFAMMRTIVLCGVALMMGAGFALAADEPSKPSSCAFVRSIDRWERIDDTHAYIYTSPRRKFKLTFFAPCRDLKWALFARIDTRPSSQTCLSVGDTLVFGRGGMMPSNRWEFEERCTITEIEPVPRDGEKPAAPSSP